MFMERRQHLRVRIISSSLYAHSNNDFGVNEGCVEVCLWLLLGSVGAFPWHIYLYLVDICLRRIRLDLARHCGALEFSKMPKKRDSPIESFTTDSTIQSIIEIFLTNFMKKSWKNKSFALGQYPILEHHLRKSQRCSNTYRKLLL